MIFLEFLALMNAKLSYHIRSFFNVNSIVMFGLDVSRVLLKHWDYPHVSLYYQLDLSHYATTTLIKNYGNH